MDIIAFDVLIKVGAAAFVVTTIVEAVKQRMDLHYEVLSDSTRQFIGYGIVLVSGGLMWFTGLDMFPGFNTVVPFVGRVLTCIAGGLGPKLVYDIWLDRPEAPTSDR